MAANAKVLTRLEQIQKQLMAGHGGGTEMSSATRGREREDFLAKFLETCLPPQYRFGTGDIVDSADRSTGQLDLVVELPFLPSFPMIGATPRLYLAEGVAAVIEVKSNLTAQWEEANDTGIRVKALSRERPGAYFGNFFAQIPFFVVGFRGWKTREPVEQRVQAGIVDGILILESGLFVGRMQALGLEHPTATLFHAAGPAGFLALLSGLHLATRQTMVPGITPLHYGIPIGKKP